MGSSSGFELFENKVLEQINNCFTSIIQNINENFGKTINLAICSTESLELYIKRET